MNWLLPYSVGMILLAFGLGGLFVLVADEKSVWKNRSFNILISCMIVGSLTLLAGIIGSH